MNRKSIEKLLYCGLGGTAITEMAFIGQKVYQLVITGKCIYFAGGTIGIPYYWLIEWIAIPIAPVAVKVVANLLSKDKITDETELVSLFKKLNERGDNNDI